MRDKYDEKSKLLIAKIITHNEIEKTYEEYREIKDECEEHLTISVDEQCVKCLKETVKPSQTMVCSFCCKVGDIVMISERNIRNIEINKVAIIIDIDTNDNCKGLILSKNDVDEKRASANEIIIKCILETVGAKWKADTISFTREQITKAYKALVK